MEEIRQFSERVLSLGSGQPVLVVHGGPGFGHGYLVSPLRALADKHRFLFFDQPGCGANRHAEPVTLTETAAMLLEVLRELVPLGPLPVLAHSFGVLVLAAAYDLDPPCIRSQVRGGVLINPVPLDAGSFHAAREAFGRTIPADVSSNVLSLAASGASGEEIMQVLLPFYLARRDVTVPGLELSLATYQHVMATLGSFDHSAALSLFRSFFCLRGAADITPGQRVSPILEAVLKVEELPGAGHFPLHERPDLALPELREMLSRSTPS